MGIVDVLLPEAQFGSGTAESSSFGNAGTGFVKSAGCINKGFAGSIPEAGRTRLGMVDGMLEGMVDGTINGAAVEVRSTVSPKTSGVVAGGAAGFGLA